MTRQQTTSKSGRAIIILRYQLTPTLHASILPFDESYVATPNYRQWPSTASFYFGAISRPFRFAGMADEIGAGRAALLVARSRELPPRRPIKNSITRSIPLIATKDGVRVTIIIRKISLSPARTCRIRIEAATHFAPSHSYIGMPSIATARGLF